MCLTATANREVAQMLVSATSEEGLDKEAWARLGQPEKLTVHVLPEQVMVLTGGAGCTT